jgi:hypothetical protein
VFAGVGSVDYGSTLGCVTLVGIGGALQGLLGARGDVIRGATQLGISQGNDIVDFSGGTGLLISTVNLRGGADQRFLYDQLACQITAGGGADLITLANCQNDTTSLNAIDGGKGNDTIEGAVFSGQFLCGDGNDTVNPFFNVTSFADVHVKGGLGDDILYVTASDAPLDLNRG